MLDLGQSKANSFVGTPAYMCPELFEQKAYNNRVSIKWYLYKESLNVQIECIYYILTDIKLGLNKKPDVVITFVP